MKQWMPLLTFVNYFGAEGVEAVENFESRQKHQVGMHTFAKMAAVADPRFLQEALEVMKTPKPTVATLVTAIVRGARRQWYTWHVMSNGTPVHAERSVFLCRCAWAFGVEPVWFGVVMCLRRARRKWHHQCLRILTLCTGTELEVNRLMTQLRSLRLVRVNVGKWRPLITADDINQRMPKASLLLKAPLWTELDLDQVRKILKSPLLRVESSELMQAKKLEVVGGRSSVLVINNTGSAMPPAAATIKVALILLDVRASNVEELRFVHDLPGRSRFVSTPVMVIGNVAEVEEARRNVVKATHGEWSGTTRSIDILTSEPSPQYTCGRRRLLVMIPSGNPVCKVPPVVNIRNQEAGVLGWVAAIGMLASLWRLPHTDVVPGDPAGSAPVEWVYCVGDDAALPVALTTRLDNTPSIIYSPTQQVPSVADLGDTVANHLRQSEQLPTIPWMTVGDAWRKFLPLFPDVEESDGEGSAVEDVAAPAVKPAAVPKTRAAAPPAKPKPQPKPKAAKSPKEPKPRTLKRPRTTEPGEEGEDLLGPQVPEPPPEASQRARSRSPSAPAAREPAGKDRQSERDRSEPRRREQQRAEDLERSAAAARDEGRERDRENARRRQRELDEERERAAERRRQLERERERGRDAERDRDRDRVSTGATSSQRDRDRDRLRDRDENRDRDRGREGQRDRDSDRGDTRERSGGRHEVRRPGDRGAESSTSSRAPPRRTAAEVKKTLGTRRPR